MGNCIPKWWVNVFVTLRIWDSAIYVFDNVNYHPAVRYADITAMRGNAANRRTMIKLGGGWVGGSSPTLIGDIDRRPKRNTPARNIGSLSHRLKLGDYCSNEQSVDRSSVNNAKVKPPVVDMHHSRRCRTILETVLFRVAGSHYSNICLRRVRQPEVGGYDHSVRRYRYKKFPMSDSMYICISPRPRAGEHLFQQQ